jgi:flagellin
MLLRISELAMQAANDTYSDVQRGFLDNEFSQLKEEINRMAKTHEWNGFKILAGAADGDNKVTVGGTTPSTPQPLGSLREKLELYFQVGDSASQSITVQLPNFTEKGNVTRAIFYSDYEVNANDEVVQDGTTATTIKTVTGAHTVSARCKMALDKVSESRSMMGAIMNRLEHVVDNLTNVSMNSAASRSQIQDADYAKASTDLAKSQIMSQAATAVLAQANTSQQTVLKLLG